MGRCPANGFRCSCATNKPVLANGFIGGFLPLITLSLAAVTGNIYAGSAFPGELVSARQGANPSGCPAKRLPSKAVPSQAVQS
jgi:hypothetical protein